MKRAKIIATIGPASANKVTLEKMIKAGVDVCRINFSFGSQESHLELIKLIRDTANKVGKSIAIAQCLQGPKIRMGHLKSEVTVKKGQEITLSGNSVHDEKKCILPTTYSQIANDTKKDKVILVADGKIILKVISTNKVKKEVKCKVVEGGTILTGKGINLPYTKISLPCLTEKDIEDATFAIKNGVNYIDLSFVRHPKDILQLRNLIENLKPKHHVGIIAKIEKPEALENIEGIIENSDGIMIARGDLADEISFAKVPVVQKRLIHEANKRGKITIVATEMLSSMIENSLPTRAEASDVANAILDGADVVMLSNETAMGKFPVDSVKVMSAIIEETEKTSVGLSTYEHLDLPEIHKLNEAMCSCAANLSYNIDHDMIIVFTRSGLTAKILSKFRPECYIYAATFDEKVYEDLALCHNIHPLLISRPKGDDTAVLHNTIDLMKNKLLEKKLAKKGQNVIFLTDTQNSQDWNINSIEVHTL